MTLQVGDLVMVRRSSLPSRVGVLTRLGKKAHVRSGHKTKRFSHKSVELLIRTRVKIEES